MQLFSKDTTEWEKNMTSIITDFTKSINKVLKLAITSTVNLATTLAILGIITLLLCAKFAPLGNKKKYVFSAVSIAILWLLIFIISSIK